MEGLSYLGDRGLEVGKVVLYLDHHEPARRTPCFGYIAIVPVE
jgi:hypothetical protein